MTYTIADKQRDQKHADDRDKRIKKRDTFLGNFDKHGLEYEIQDCKVSCRNIAICYSLPCLIY